MPRKIIDTSTYAAYEKDGVIRSAYQRREHVTLWEEEDGSITTEVRHLTKKELRYLERSAQELLDKAIADGKAVRDRVGRVRWIK